MGYGYRLAEDRVRLEEDADEQPGRARARELRVEGLSLRAIGRGLLAEGHQPRSGKRWHVQVVARILQ